MRPFGRALESPQAKRSSKQAAGRIDYKGPQKVLPDDVFFAGIDPCLLGRRGGGRCWGSVAD